MDGLESEALYLQAKKDGWMDGWMDGYTRSETSLQVE